VKEKAISTDDSLVRRIAMPDVSSNTNWVLDRAGHYILEAGNRVPCWLVIRAHFKEEPNGH